MSQNRFERRKIERQKDRLLTIGELQILGVIG